MFSANKLIWQCVLKCIFKCFGLLETSRECFEMLTPFTGPALSLLLQSQLFAELHNLPPLYLKNLSQHETVPPTSPGEGLASPPSAPWASMTINFLFLRRIRTSSVSAEQDAASTDHFLAGNDGSGWSFHHPAAKLVPAAPPTHTGTLVRGGRPESRSPQRGTALLLSSVAEGQRVCSMKQGMPKAWTHQGFYTHRALAEGLLVSGAHQGYSYRSFSSLTSSERNPFKAVQGWLVSQSHTQ